MSETNKVSYTPGPWIDDGFDGINTQIIHSQWGEIARVVANGDILQREANARLIAAAPDLLEACKAIVEGGNIDHGAHWVVDVADIEKAIRAIAKAETN